MTRDDFKKILEVALEPIKRKQDIQTAALVEIEHDLKVYGDMFETNFV